MPKKIEKKLLPEYYAQVVKRRKTFEIRKDEDDVQVGDILTLREWDGKQYTGHKITREVTYVLRNVPEYGLMDGYCIMAIQPIGWNEEYYAPAVQMNCVQSGNNCSVIGNVGTLTIK